jgi:hypothetical protein
LVSHRFSALAYDAVDIFPRLSPPRYDLLLYGYERMTMLNRGWADYPMGTHIEDFARRFTRLTELCFQPPEPSFLPYDPIIAWVESNPLLRRFKFYDIGEDSEDEELGKTQVRGLALARLTQLTALDIEQQIVGYSSLPLALPALTALRELRIDCLAGYDRVQLPVHALSTLTNLRVLSLHDTTYWPIRAISRLTQLEDLEVWNMLERDDDFYGNDFSPFMKAVFQLTQLRRLCIGYAEPTLEHCQAIDVTLTCLRELSWHSTHSLHRTAGSAFGKVLNGLVSDFPLEMMDAAFYRGTNSHEWHDLDDSRWDAS